MDGPINFVKKHPLLSGVSVIALIGVIVLAGGSGGSAGTIQSGPSADEIAANTQITLASMENQSMQQQTAASHAVAIAQLGVQDRAATLAAQIENQRIAMASTVSLREIDSQTETALAASEVARQVSLGSQQTALAIAREEQYTNRYAAQQQAKAAKKASSNSMWGSIIVAGLSLFSDARLKTNCRYVRTIDGVRWYRYQWNAFARERFGFNSDWSEGVLAQEVLRTKYRDCVSLDQSTGYYVVDYETMSRSMRALQVQPRKLLA